MQKKELCCFFSTCFNWQVSPSKYKTFLPAITNWKGMFKKVNNLSVAGCSLLVARKKVGGSIKDRLVILRSISDEESKCEILHNRFALVQDDDASLFNQRTTSN